MLTSSHKLTDNAIKSAGFDLHKSRFLELFLCICLLQIKWLHISTRTGIVLLSERTNKYCTSEIKLTLTGIQLI